VGPNKQDRTLAEQLSGAFVTFGALVAAGFLLTACIYGVGWGYLTPELERNRQAERAESAAYAAMIDEENGLRGYLITRDARFLEAYAGGEARLPQANATLSALIGSVPSLAAARLDTRLSEERWREGWAKTVSDPRFELSATSMSDGKALFDAYRVSQATFAQALATRTQELSRREQRVIALRVALDLSVFIVVLLLAMRQHRALREAIVTPVADLLRHIRRIRDGQLKATATVAGPREFAELAAGLNEVVRALISAREIAESRDGALSDHAIRLHQILDASREFSESLNLKYVVGAVRESTAAIGGYETVIIWLMDDVERRLVMSEESIPQGTALETDHGLASRAAKAGRITFEGAAGQVRFGDGGIGSVRAIAIPLIVGARVVGVLEARNQEAQPATKEVIEILEMLATHAATAIESARLHEVIEERSHVDALTRLFNRRRLDQDLESECKRSLRYERPLALVMLDVDHFKAYNDTHGHPQADIALQEVSNAIASCVRTTDTAYRYGGEEFCILLRETSAADAMHFAERVRERIEARFGSGAMTGITASFGVAEFMESAPTARALIEAADAAMYESKRAGRNRVALSAGPAESANAG
jgi:diguanylate cyclase (GGDEF)-like protein